MNTTQRGFTLIELMIVIAILSIVTAFAIPSYQNYIIKASREEAKAELMVQINKEQQLYVLNGKHTPMSTSFVIGTVGEPPRWSIIQDRPVDQYFQAFSAVSLDRPNSTDFYDPECARMSISLELKKEAFNSSNQDTTDKCWNNK